jgi:hypothetical protein
MDRSSWAIEAVRRGRRAKDAASSININHDCGVPCMEFTVTVRSSQAEFCLARVPHGEVGHEIGQMLSYLTNRSIRWFVPRADTVAALLCSLTLPFLPPPLPSIMLRSGEQASGASPKDADGASSSPSSPTLATTTTTLEACRPEHVFHAFDALYCALAPYATPIEPLFTDDK